jgi:cell division septation protein DedD
MSNGFFSSNRSQRESEPRMSNERSRDFGGAQSRGSDRSGAGRESGEEALLELARLIGGQNDPFAPDSPPPAGRPEPRLADVSRAAASAPYESRGFDDRSAPSHRDSGFADRAPPPAPDDGDYDFGDRARGRGRLDYGAAREEEEEEYTDDEYAEPDDFDDEEPGRKRRGPSRVITTLLGLAVFGGAAAYGYRTMTAAPSAPPPIIRADNSPTKIKPMSDVKADNGRSAPFGEQVVRRDEDPVDVDGAQGSGNAGATDVVPPSPGTTPRGDPKRVHTVPIRADQGTANSPDRPSPAARAAPQSASPPASRQVAALPPQPAPPPPQPAAPPPQAAPPPPQAAASPPQRQAAVTPPADNSPAAAPPESGYVVQLTAVKSESDAQSEFRRLQAKYASVLTGRQPLIRRKDQGDRGVFFVAQVGPFGAKGEADQICDQLKAAGGTCYVYKN